MARIEEYQKDQHITEKDYLLGTDGDNFRKTKNFPIAEFTAYLQEKIGRTKIKKRLGNIGGSTVSDYINGTGPYTEVMFTCTINGEFKTYIYVGDENIIGTGYPPTDESDFQDLSQAPNEYFQSWTIDNWD